MVTDRALISQTLAEKQVVLEAARHKLKEEFVGIDGIIDTLIRNVSPWFCFPQIQERPIVINLWGMTGVGKTALVERLVELLNFQDKFFRFDLGDKESSFSFSENFATMVQQDEELPLITAFDEFQHVRTIDQMGKEIESDRNRNLWEMMASGTVHFYRWSRSIEALRDLADTLARCLEIGVEIQSGVIAKGWDVAARELRREKGNNGIRVALPDGEKVTLPGGPSDEEAEDDHLFVTDYQEDIILELAGKELNLSLKRELETFLRTLSGNQAVRFLRRVVEIGSRTTQKRFSKLLVFVMGNLDEAYTMAQDLDADRNPDRFYKESLKIGLPQIKRALQSRFRHEQVARFGNIHIIFPAIRGESFEKVIEKELAWLSSRVRKAFGIGLEFDQSVNRLVYSEGVLPTQGFRPLFSTIHNLLSSNIGFFLSEGKSWTAGVETIFLRFEGNALMGTYFSAAGQLFSRKVEVPTHVSDLRKPRADDLQASTAVHEAGHAVVHMVLEGVLPQAILSVSSSDLAIGRVERDSVPPIASREFIDFQATILLGGIAAEKMVFGESGVTSGSKEDIERATDAINQAVKNFGFGKYQMSFGLPERQNEGELHFAGVEEEAREWLLHAYGNALKILETEKSLLLMLADHLADHSRMEQAEILDFCQRYSVTGLYGKISAKTVAHGHRRMLKDAVAALDSPEKRKESDPLLGNRQTPSLDECGEVGPPLGRIASSAASPEPDSGFLHASSTPPHRSRNPSEE